MSNETSPAPTSFGPVHVHLTQPPVSYYFSLVVGALGTWTQISMHWPKPTEDQEFPSMEAFLEFAKNEGLTLPWEKETK